MMFLFTYSHLIRSRLLLQSAPIRVINKTEQHVLIRGASTLFRTIRVSHSPERERDIFLPLHERPSVLNADMKTKPTPTE